MKIDKYINPYHLFAAREDLQARGVDVRGWGEGDLAAHYAAVIEPADAEAQRRHGEMNSRWHRFCVARDKAEAEAEHATITERAQSVIADPRFTASARGVLVNWDEGEDGDWKTLHDLGLHRVQPGEEDTGAMEHTDLGAEVVRLLADEKDAVAEETTYATYARVPAPPTATSDGPGERDWDAELHAIAPEMHWTDAGGYADPRWQTTSTADFIMPLRQWGALTRLLCERNVADVQGKVSASVPTVADHDGRLGEIAKGT